MVDHYTDGQPTGCDGCQRAAAVRAEWQAIGAPGPSAPAEKKDRI